MSLLKHSRTLERMDKPKVKRRALSVVWASKRKARLIMRVRHGVAWIAQAVAAGALAISCGNSPTGPSSGCGGGLVFSVLPVPLGAINAATPIGNMGPPVHTHPHRPRWVLPLRNRHHALGARGTRSPP